MEYKVVFHINELDKWDTLLTNLKKLVVAGEKNTSVEVVINGKAVKYLNTEEKLGQDLEELTKLSGKGVIFSACRNALKGNKIEEESLYFFVNVVPAGVLELTKKQNEGYAYIKP